MAFSKAADLVVMVTDCFFRRKKYVRLLLGLGVRFGRSRGVMQNDEAFEIVERCPPFISLVGYCRGQADGMKGTIHATHSRSVAFNYRILWQQVIC